MTEADPRIVTVQAGGRQRPDCDALVYLAGTEAPLPLREGGEELATLAAELAGRAGWSGRREQRVDTVAPSGTQVSLRGLGSLAELAWEALAKDLATTLDDLARSGCRSVELVLAASPLTRGFEAIERLGLAIALHGYRFGTFRKAPKEPPPRLERVRLHVPRDEDRATWELALVWSQLAARATVRARDLANTPPNVATPEWLAERARKEGRSLGLEVRVLEGRELERKGCGGLLAVGAGSSSKPRLVVVEWAPKAAGSNKRIALVGKGVTFDSGGYSIKPSQGLEDMKYDKCGACTVLAVVLAAAEVGLRLHLEAYLPLAENGVDAAAYRPGDIVRHPDGTTTEIHNTDAEGRLILADAICLARAAKPDHLIELSTLTGACVVALGHRAAGLWTPSDELARQLAEAADRAGERVWRMPLFAEDAKAMEGVHADLKNVAGREGGANTAAAFLSHFAGDHPSWAHLDIAGVAFGADASKRAGGATGWGVATLLQWLRTFAANRGVASND